MAIQEFGASYKGSARPDQLVTLDGSGSRRRRRHRWRAAALATSVVVAGLAQVGPGRAADAVSVTVDAGAVTGSSKFDLSTTLVYHGVLDPLRNGVASFAALHMPLVRIHAGTDAVYPGSGPELPEGVTQGDWSFGELDELVGDVRATGSSPMLNVRYAPDWMWTCTSYFDPSAAGVGTLRDRTFGEFADYMARLVSYYNVGRAVTESGAVIVNPLGTSRRIDVWEIWNEPDLSNETPCHPADWGPALSAADYTRMWNVVAPRMRAVDPSIRLVGPVTANPTTPGTAPADDYFATLMASGAPRPDALSFHAYGYWDNTASDKVLFDGDESEPGCCGGVRELGLGVSALTARYPGVPVYVSEFNVSADWGDDPNGRPWGALGAAWGASAFRSMVLGGAALGNEYSFVASPQFGQIDEETGATRLPYWRDRILSAAFPAGSTLLSATSTDLGVETMAVRRNDGTVAVLVVNRRPTSATATDGVGLATSVTVDFRNVDPAGLSVRLLDASTPAATGPATTVLAGGSTVRVDFAGYGMAVVEAHGNAPAPPPTTTTPPPTSSAPPSSQPTTSSTGATTTTSTSTTTTTTTGPTTTSSSSTTTTTTTTTTTPPTTDTGGALASLNWWWWRLWHG